MMTMRERCARALCIKAGFDPDRPGYSSDHDGWVSTPPIWHLYLVYVDVCLETLMEPTHEMVAESARIHSGAGIPIAPHTAAWQAMIRAATGEI